MTTTEYTAFQTLIRKFAVTRVGMWFFAHSAHALDRMFVKLSRGHRTMASITAGLPTMIMTTRGAKTGLVRVTPLAYIQDITDEKRIAVIASNFGQHHLPGWYFNLKAHPQVSCTLAGKTKTYLAYEASGEEYERFWSYAVRTFPGYAVYKQRANRRVPIMVLTLQEPSTSRAGDQHPVPAAQAK